MNNQRCNINNNNSGDEVTEILKKIVGLQRAAIREELREEMCDADFLGDRSCGYQTFNTRPLQIFTANDVPWYCPIDRNEDGCHEIEHESTCIFRVEKVEGGAAIFRALKDCGLDPDPSCNRRLYESTDSYITIKLENIAALRCLKDAFVELCI